MKAIFEISVYNRSYKGTGSNKLWSRFTTSESIGAIEEELVKRGYSKNPAGNFTNPHNNYLICISNISGKCEEISKILQPL